MSTTQYRFRLARIPAQDWFTFATSVHETGKLRHVVGNTDFINRWTVALVIVDQRLIGAGLVRRYGRLNAAQSELRYRNLEFFEVQPPWAELVVGVPASLRQHASPIDGKVIPEGTSRGLYAALVRLVPGAQAILARLHARLSVDTPVTDSERTVYEQRDAAALGLEIAGLDSRALLDSSHEMDLSLPFMSGLRRERNSEAAMIRHDAAAFDGWLKQQSRTFDVMSFADPGDTKRRVDVIYADKEALERQTGTDLLYYRHHKPGFILVQYKRMNAASPSRGHTYYPDGQLRKEIERFKHLPESPKATTADDWRITRDAFYVKLVRADMAKPADHSLVQGMYLPLSLVDLLLAESAAGSRAKGWSMETISTYLSNGEFLMLAKQGYVGTSGGATDALKEIVVQSFNAHRGLVVVADQTVPGEARRLRHG